MTTQAVGYEGDGGSDSEEEGPPPKELKASPRYAAPEGFESVGSNVLGYWDPEDSGPVEFTPIGVRLIDNGKDKHKSSALIIAELRAPVSLIKNETKKEDQVLAPFPEGTVFGIWAKAGMRDLANMQGAHVWMAPDGFKKLKDDDKNPMALFKINKKKGSVGTRLVLSEDGRKESITEAAKTDNPPWHLIVLGDDFGKAKAAEILIKSLNKGN